MPNSVFSSVTVSPIFSARTCASLTGVSSTWCVMAGHRERHTVPSPHSPSKTGVNALSLGEGQGGGSPHALNLLLPPSPPLPRKGGGSRPVPFHRACSHSALRKACSETEIDRRPLPSRPPRPRRIRVRTRRRAGPCRSRAVAVVGAHGLAH